MKAIPDRSRSYLSIMVFAWLRAAVVLPAFLSTAGASAEPVSPVDLQLLIRSLAFLTPPPTGTRLIAIAYDANNPASRAEAEQAAAGFAGGIQVGQAVVRAVVADQAKLQGGTEYVGIIALPGDSNPAIMALARKQQIPCLTTDPALVQSGACVIAVRSSPSIEVVLNQAAARAAGISFAAAFRLMVRTI